MEGWQRAWHEDEAIAAQDAGRKLSKAARDLVRMSDTLVDQEEIGWSLDDASRLQRDAANAYAGARISLYQSLGYERPVAVALVK